MENFRASYDNISQVQQRVTALVDKIVEFLDELAEVESESYHEWDRIPCDGVADLLSELVCQLRLMFTMEEDPRWLEEIFQERPYFSAAVRRLHAAHDGLLAQLDGVFELTGSPLRPASTWNDIESSFRRFVAHLADHEVCEDDLIQQVISDEKGVID